VLVAAALLAGPTSGTARAAPMVGPPAIGAPATCGNAQLAPTLASDLDPHGNPVTPTADRAGTIIPVIMVHGWTGSATNDRATGSFSKLIDLSTLPPYSAQIPRSLIGQLQLVPGAAIYTFDYHEYSGRWVTDDHLGPALGRAIDCLYAATHQKVIVVGHSMGGLVARWALTHPGRGNINRAGEVSTVVTLGTPETGSVLAELAAEGLNGAARTAVPGDVAAVLRVLLSVCGQQSSKQIDTGTACDVLPTFLRTFEGDASRALRYGSPQLQALAPFPSGVNLDAVAGNNVFHITDLGWFGIRAPGPTGVPAGDLIVSQGSATSGATRTKVGTCNYQLNMVRAATDQVGLLLGLTARGDVAQPPWKAAGPCYHANVMRTRELTNEVIGAVADDIALRQPVTLADLASAPVPSLCEHPAGTLVNGRLPGIPENQGTVELRPTLAGGPGYAFGDLTGDSVRDAAVVVDCDQGGVPWPESVQLYRSGNGQVQRLGGVSLEEISSQHGAGGRDGVHSITTANQAVTVHWSSNRPSDFGCCATLDLTAQLRWNGHQVVVNNVSTYDEIPTATQLFRAVANHDRAALTAVATPTVADELLAETSRVTWTGHCYGAMPIMDTGWPADAQAQFGEWPSAEGGFKDGERFCLVRSPTGGPYGLVGFTHTGYRQWQAVEYMSPQNWD
jgi:pimeloyl-ACP methyl ester carboxylesterase